MEHADAIISDSFWYIICRVFLKKLEKIDYEPHQEFLLDRIAANYVSFTLIEDTDIPSKGRGNTKSKESSFKSKNT